MILTGNEIKKMINEEKIKISPFNPENITTNSYDLHLGNKILKYKEEVLDTKKENSYEVFEIPQDGYLLNPGDFVLAMTNETFGSDFFVPLLHNKSGVARLGLFVHITSDLIDLGFHGNITLQLFATLPIKIYPNMKIAQVTFWQPKGEIELYKGKYQNDNIPKPSKSYLDF